ncbi:hypothetical protein Gotri_011819 [Gossypium trilobum]|uniref:Endonuclease/exonuclease/phosphatase domain-containing protein n=1 Tax=Gossypium trilobum TaxID=34281 RepID=A0A7J9EVK2_9ROSI|nr:hypothetical protein [Gossypium trilobum]
MEINKEQEGSVLVGISAHFNSTFDGLVESLVLLSSEILNPKNHSAVTFKDTERIKHAKSLENGTTVGRGKGSSFLKGRGSGIKGIARSSGAISKVIRERKFSGSTRVPLADTMNSMAKLISSQINLEAKEEGQSSDEKRCASKKFLRFLREYNREYKSDIIGLLETRVSGSKVDLVIASLSFQRSHWVEAIDFSGGIWVGWKETIQVEIMRSHLQFVMTKISYSYLQRLIYVVFIYGSPNIRKRRGLWDALKVTIPCSSFPWIVVRDFNAILTSNEKRGGRVNGKRCSFFWNFMESSDLHDLGFKGAPFTWHRGGVFE